MPRYIDADWIVQKLEGWQDQLAETYGENDEYVLCLGEVLMKLDDTPTADVVERKRGKWMKHNDRACWYCSECKEDNYYAYSWNSDTGKYEFQDHYCSNCGAEMRGEDDD